MQVARATVNATEAMAARANGSVFVLDEMAHLSGQGNGTPHLRRCWRAWKGSAQRQGRGPGVRFNAQSGEVEAQITLPSGGSGVTVAYGSVWVTGITKGELYRIEPKTNAVVMTVPLKPSPRYVVAAEGSVWVMSEGTGTLQQIDGRTGLIAAAFETGKPGWGDFDVGGGYVWQSGHGAVLQIDPAAHRGVVEGELIPNAEEQAALVEARQMREGRRLASHCR